jgi:hypothetical protein
MEPNPACPDAAMPKLSHKQSDARALCIDEISF